MSAEPAPHLSRKTKHWRKLLFVLGGAALGLLYQRVIGCSTGTCPISSSPYISTLYGAFMGYLASSGFRWQGAAAEGR